MDNFLSKNRYAILGLILILGLYLRNHNLHTWPRLGATFDEYAWTWQGMNLIQKGTPISWSPHPQYQNAKDIYYQKVHFRIVTPFLEHPPLFGLVAGSFALLNGASDMYHLTLQNIRSLALLLGVLSIFILYIFAAEAYGYKIGLLSAFLYSFVPTIVVGSRIVQNENFFIPLFLLSLFLIIKFVNTSKSWYRNLAAVLCGLLCLAKVPWIVGIFAIILIFCFLRKYKDILWFLSISIPIFLLYFIYGLYYDSSLFLSLWQLQLNRYDIAFNSFFALLTSPYLIDRFLVDGWIYFGWFAMFLLIAKNIKNNLYILFPFLAYLLIYVFAIPNEPSHGWYRYPFYPFMIISIAVFLKDYFNKNQLLTFLFLAFTGLSMLQLSIGQAFGFSFLIFRIFLILFSFSLWSLFIPKSNKLSSIANYFSLVIIVILSIWSVRLYNEQ